jgi:RNA polymerase sigma factor (sigma-70 family)
MYKDETPRDGLNASLAEQFVIEHGNAVLRVARSYCNSAQDADDAYQRTIELMMVKAPAGLSNQQLFSWACTVAKNESLMQARGRRLSVVTDFDEIADALESDLPTPDAVYEDDELLHQGREVLSQLRPDQARCLLLRADDMSYPEICEKTGFSYAKVNRLLSEGRQAMRHRHEMLVSGNDCRRFENVISPYADGEADPATVLAFEMHLEHCMGCKATLRDYRGTADRVAGVMPIGLLAAAAGGRGIFGRIGDQFQSIYSSLQERLFGHAAAGQHSFEIATAKKIAAVAAIGGSLVVGGAAIEKHNNSAAPNSGTDPSAAIVGTSHLVDDVKLSSAERKRARSAELKRKLRAKAATDNDLVASQKDGSDSVSTAPAQDTAVAQDQADYAADPADQSPAGSDNAQAPSNAGTGP